MRILQGQLSVSACRHCSRHDQSRLSLPPGSPWEFQERAKSCFIIKPINEDEILLYM